MSRAHVSLTFFSFLKAIAKILFNQTFMEETSSQSSVDAITYMYCNNWYGSSLNILKGWIFFRGDYFRGWIYELFSPSTIRGWIYELFFTKHCSTVFQMIFHLIFPKTCFHQFTSDFCEEVEWDGCTYLLSTNINIIIINTVTNIIIIIQYCLCSHWSGSVSKRNLQSKVLMTWHFYKIKSRKDKCLAFKDLEIWSGFN